MTERSEHTVRSRVIGWVGARLLVATVLVGATLLTLETAFVSFTPLALSYGAAAIFFASGLSAIALREGKHAGAQLVAQPAIDLAAITMLVYFLGGASSGLTALYGVTALATAFVLGPRAAVFTTFFAIALYVTLSACFAIGWLLPPPDQNPAPYALSGGELSIHVLRNVLGISLVAWLGATLSMRVQSAGGQIEALKKKAEDAERLAALGRLAAAFAHEIRNPLGAISGSVQLLGDNPNLGGEDRKLLEIVARETSRLDELIATMLAFGRPRPPEPRVADLRTLVQDVVSVARKDPALSSGLRIEVTASDSVVEASIDDAQVRQVLWNLIKNAIQASRAESEVRVEVERDKQGRAVVSVTDEGVGIAKENLPHIFEAFFTGRTQGTGLGLALVKQIVEAHGGHVEVQSTIDRGTTFRAIFPALERHSRRPSFK